MSQATDKMNCTEVQDALTANPAFDDESGHLQDCADCQAYQNNLQALDRRIRAAMEVDVPKFEMPELPNLDSSNVATLPVRRKMTAPVRLAVAATIALAVFAGLRVGGPENTEHSLAEQVLAHLDHDPAALLPSDTPVDDDDLRRVVPRNIASMNHDAGLITFAETCPINGNSIPHLVIQGERGPITIMLLPDEKISAAISLDGENVHGSILPVGEGSVAIIGTRDEQLDNVKRSVMNSVAWDI
tara:strand:- start:7235 stop:7966 length:732 start_codon:yes stop_codon:yes gene_type:complete